MNNQPIGIFDSGIGGLTVAKAVMRELPHEDIIYFGDTARVPYGIKSEQTIKQYARQITEYLLRKEVKMILVACNTVSASAHQTVINRVQNIPVLDVITAGTAAALQHSSQKIGVIGTLATIDSRAYENSLHQQQPGINVISHACPLLVPLAEEGWVNNKVARQTLRIYLKKFKEQQPDTLILGCTHYPLFKKSIQKELNNPDIHIVDSAISIAQQTHRTLNEHRLKNPKTDEGDFKCIVSDKPQRFQQLAERFLGRSLPDVEVIDLKEQAELFESL